MSKIKELEKVKPEKEHIKVEKLEKHEQKEFKEPIKEKVEHKEIKEKPEKTEHKEKPEKAEHKEKAEKLEHKEIKEHVEKQITEKGGKEIAETTQPGGEVFQAQLLSAQTSGTSSAKQIAKEIEKQQKEIEKIKPEKEHLKNELKDHKIEKFEIKEIKHEKFELKEHKIEIFEKAQHKEFLPEKGLLENDPKGVAETGPLTGPGSVETGNVFEGTGSPEDRLGQLEQAVSKLSHFIGVNLRPDLSSGALKSEPDVKDAKSTESDKAPKPKS